jgi:hypothetical protein
MHIFIYITTHTYTYAYICVSIYASLHKVIPIHLSVSICEPVHTHTHTHTHTHAHTRTHTYMSARPIWQRSIFCCAIPAGRYAQPQGHWSPCVKLPAWDQLGLAIDAIPLTHAWASAQHLTRARVRERHRACSLPAIPSHEEMQTRSFSGAPV